MERVVCKMYFIMIKKIIGFDLDGVILDHTLNKIRIAKKLNFDIQMNQTPSSIISKVMPLHKYKRLKFYLYDNSKTAFESSIMLGAVLLLDKLKKNNTPFFLVSRRQTTKIPVQILKMYNLWPKFFNEENSFFVLKKADKDKKALELGITHFVDDEIAVLSKLKSVKHKYLFDPFNAFPKSDYVKVKSWVDLKRHLLA
jgi:hypothetical protein